MSKAPLKRLTAGTVVTQSGGITTLVVCNSFIDCGEHGTVIQRLRQDDKALGTHLDYRHILQQTIEKKRFSGDVLRALAVNKTIQTACLKGADITGQNVDLLCAMLVRNTTLQKLSLEGCNLQGSAFEDVAKHLAENRSIRYLNLRSNFLEYEGAKQLFTHLPRSRVTAVNLSQNGIIDAAGGLFQILKKAQREFEASKQKGLPDLPSVLTQLDISSNQISPVVRAEIMGLVTANARELATTIRPAKERAKVGRAPTAPLCNASDDTGATVTSQAGLNDALPPNGSIDGCCAEEPQLESPMQPDVVQPPQKKSKVDK
eukprot:GGOE01014001.1.p1 GENE.GGOE01014001.1~~GGOE01014001.1.p1  ORF type:complete len:340 (-),score=66.11 GGOE01014001.1:163-1113(-)